MSKTALIGTLSRQALIHRLRWTTRLLAHNTQSTPHETSSFVDVNDFLVDWNADERKWWFEWKGDCPAKSFLWQVTTLPPPGDFLTWKKPAGLVASGHVQGPTHRFVVDFARFAAVPGSHGPVMTPLRRVDFHQAVRGRLSVLKRKGQLKSPEAARLSGWSQTLKPKLQMRPRPKMTPRLRKARFAMKTERGPPPARWHYYVRVVLLNDKGQPLSVSSMKRIRYGEPLPQTQVVIHDVKPTEVPLPNPCLSVRAYDPYRPRAGDYYYHWLVASDPDGIWKQWYKKGDHLDFSPKEKSFWDKVGDAISSVVDFFSGAVDWVAKAYDWVKARAVDAACMACPGVPREWIEAGLNAGLASMGIPPSLPNFDQLTSMGKDYLVATVAEQAGIPPDVASMAVDKMVSEATKASQGPSGGAPMGLNFLRLHPNWLGHPARLDLVMKNRLPQRTFPVNVLISDSLKLFQERYVWVPAMEPGEELKIPVHLTPNNIQYCFQSPDAHSLSAWDNLIKTRSTHFSASILAGVSIEKVVAEMGLKAYGGMGFTWKTLALPKGWHRELKANAAWTAPTSFNVPQMKK